jgi:high-affinity iron transporter
MRGSFMLPTFIIGLREGVEAALIVGIVAAFLAQEGRRGSLKFVWAGVALATVICVAIGVGLQALNQELPHREQEILETVIGLVAVGMVTWMIVWMRRHSSEMRSSIEGSTRSALAQGSALALIGMAFFAVLREGIETSVFLLAIFQGADDPLAAGIGALLGLLTAVVIGYAIYRGGLRLNLGRFFKLTSVVLVFLAAGLLANVAESAWEAGLVTSFQAQAIDLSWLVVPETWSSALMTGMLGLQARMSQAQIFVYLIYLVPMLAYVLWPEDWRLPALTGRRAASREPGNEGANPEPSSV